MTYPVTVTKSGPHTANGVNVTFQYTFKIYASTDIEVIQTDLDGIESVVSSSAYSLTGIGSDSGGNVVFSIAPTNGYLITPRLKPPVAQGVNLRNQGSYLPEEVERALDRQAMISAYLAEELSRTPKIDISSDGDTATYLQDCEAARVAAEAASATAVPAASAASSSASAAAASAASAAAAVASALWRDVVFVAGNYTVTQADNGKLIRFDTTAASRTVTLPQISALTLPFSVGIEKQTSGANTVTVNRAGTDTIDGATSKVFSTQGAGAALIADTDSAPDEWSALEFGPVDLSAYAPLASPTFTGTPAAPTASGGTNTTQIATTAFVQSAIAAIPTPSSFSAFKNKLINGDFKRWDYATTYALTTTAAYGSANRWGFLMATSAAGIANRDNSVPTPSTTVESFRYSLKLGRNSGSALTGGISMTQVLETANSKPLAGKQCTLSFYAKAGANFSAASSNMGVYVATGTGTDQSLANFISASWTGQSALVNTNQAINTTWTKYSFTFTVGATANQLGLSLSYTPVGTAGADDNIYITGVQLEIGASATAFEDRDEGVEALLCARYLPYYSFSGGGAEIVAFGQAQGTNQTRIGIPFTAEARVAPTGLVVSSAGHFSVSRAVGATVCSSVTLPANTATKKMGGADCALGSSPLTLDFCYFTIANTAAWLYYTGCEL